MFVLSTGAKERREKKQTKQVRETAGLFTQPRALFEGSDDNQERSALSATERRGEPNVWQQVFSGTRNVGIRKLNKANAPNAAVGARR